MVATLKPKRRGCRSVEDEIETTNFLHRDLEGLNLGTLEARRKNLPAAGCIDSVVENRCDNAEVYMNESEKALVRACAHAAHLSYGVESSSRENAVKTGLTFFDLIIVENHRVLLLTNENTIFIAFRGTLGWRDWLANFNCFPIQRQWGYAHRGFIYSFEALLKKLKENICHEELAGKSIILTGHSLGGAMATIAALQLGQEKYPIAGLITFGQPPLGSQSFNKNVKSMDLQFHRRIVNGIDVVATSPLFYFHHYRATYFDHNKKEYDGVPWLLWPYHAFMFGWRIKENGPFAQFRLHGMERYSIVVGAKNLIFLKSKT